MTEALRSSLAQMVLALHLVVIGFNLFGLVAVPIGAWLRLGFVRLFWWRALHLACLAVVAAQAIAGQACFLTLLQDALSGAGREPLVMSWINRLLFWPLPAWVFATIYVLLFAYALALWRFAPPASPRRRGA